MVYPPKPDEQVSSQGGKALRWLEKLPSCRRHLSMEQNMVMEMRLLTLLPAK